MSDTDRDSAPGEHTEAFTPEFTGALAAASVLEQPATPAVGMLPPHPAQPVVLPGVAQYLSRWRFVLVVFAVWIVAAAAGAGLYYWWFHSLDKTMPVFVVLVYLVAATVGSLLTALVQNRPAAAALAIGLMSAPLAAVSGAALLYGGYVFGWISR
ncbi:hypothetical protein [Mycobacterium sp. SMC-4]|uniref:hypothetical protein n=1 Tax=Mycobacterium sp. SMC-4 TaxID=2857059 RepID=UPI0021B44903|nr:hypothetical protein [Mycobacterium sp. SMC-4]UXA18615.1 hypothetical protein KXD98_02590 [Mycobacterium sp. SMC-4]